MEQLFAHDLGIMVDNASQLQDRLVRWQEGLERYRLKVNAKKTEVLVCSKKGDEKD